MNEFRNLRDKIGVKQAVSDGIQEIIFLINSEAQNSIEKIITKNKYNDNYFWLNGYGINNIFNEIFWEGVQEKNTGTRNISYREDNIISLFPNGKLYPLKEG